jgi:hypothetical protein
MKVGPSGSAIRSLTAYCVQRTFTQPTPKVPCPSSFTALKELNVKSQSNFDIVVYGATGFTGQLVAEYLASRYHSDSNLKWAMAGRSLDKLASVRDAIGAPADTALIHAESGDLASLRAMANQTKLVVSTVGPYQLYGSELVALCVESGTDYVDLCGEPVWMRPAMKRLSLGIKSQTGVVDQWWPRLLWRRVWPWRRRRYRPGRGRYWLRSALVISQSRHFERQTHCSACCE